LFRFQARLSDDQSRDCASTHCTRAWTSACGVVVYGMSSSSSAFASSELITVSPQRLGGVPVFAGTRVPVQALFDYLRAGDPLDRFLEHFPDVTREHALAVLEKANTALIKDVAAAE
jgi:uncharacterized protein (DUF433 family)